LIAASGIWQNGSVYDVYLDNGTKFDPNQNGGNAPTGDLGIADLAGNSLQADFGTGFTQPMPRCCIACPMASPTTMSTPMAVWSR
jgi:hypothetical protein